VSTVLLADVLAVHEVLSAAGIGHWVGGGWGVDALVGRQTRPHRDLDLAVDAERLEEAVRLLSGLGYASETDWLPVRLELVADGGRWVDLHPVVFEASGQGRQAGLDGTHFDYPPEDLVSGRIGDHPLACLSVRRQLAFHSGYDPRPVDVADLALLEQLTG
jgi:lincosamide nucleotidyltransferase A/C/D/E